MRTSSLTHTLVLGLLLGGAPMKVIQPNYTWIPRAQGIAQQMSAWPEVSYVESGPYSPTAVRFYKLSEVASFDRGVTVTLSYEGQCQKIRLFPKAEVSSREFLELVQAKLHTLKISPDVPISSQSVTNNPQAVVDPESSIKESPMAVAPIRRVFRGTDHNTIKGTDRFIDFLAEHPMVKKIVTARVQGGPQYTEPRAEFRSAKYAVQAYWINANAKQEILAFPADGTSVDVYGGCWKKVGKRGISVAEYLVRVVMIRS